MKLRNVQSRILTSIILFTLLILMFNSLFISTYLLIVFGVLSIIEFSKILEKIFIKKILKIFVNTFFIIYITAFCYFFYFLSYYFFTKIVLFTLILGCVASDIGGYLFGKFFKGRKLTKISPNKTYSGAIGSIILTNISISMIFFLHTNSSSYLILIVSTMTSFSCQIGDLLFSFLKRKANIKDTGSILPGHGGVLDRLDGILLGVPIGYILFILII